MDDKLIEFLDSRIAQFKELEALSDVVMKVTTPNALGDSYRMLIERVKESYEAVDKADRQNNKSMKKNPAIKEDSRVAWFNSVVSALHQASSHSRPPVNSRDLGKIHSAAYEIQIDLSFCRHELEKKRESLA